MKAYTVYRHGIPYGTVQARNEFAAIAQVARELHYSAKDAMSDAWTAKEV
jgi:hypothetical protein